MLKLYNTLSRKKEVFRPRKPPQVGMYICGPTVYGPSHLGHARTYVAFDVIRKYLELKRYKVRYILNITDIHDDIIKASKKLKINIRDLARKYTKQFFQDIKALGIKKASLYPQVSKHIKEIIKMLKTLEGKGFAYERKGSVYFDISKFPDYGKLSRIKLKKEISGTRIATDKYEKEEAMDFALWKKTRPEEPTWPSPWGKGRPGWHIECSVMSQKYLGKQIDIHGGAKDLIFPHHENEIAQSEAATGKKPFVKYWLHGGLLTVNKQKMSKSLGNYIEIPQMLKEYSPRLIRFFIISSHYRSPLDFNKRAIKQDERSLRRLDEFVDKLKSLKSKKDKKIYKKLTLITKKEFERHMDNDFNTPRALASIFKLINRGNLLLSQNKLAFQDVKDILKFLRKIDKVFNFIFWEKPKKEKAPKKILKLVEEREKYRQEKEWKKADEIRREIKKMGWQIEDTKEGPKIKNFKQ
ncbi:cysteine--tRNA ligase [Patescibacteria group bacterium]|nr:cysteine--tRNA ligase [Patescibacteria group bacterium]